jgi:hypothetical protein
MVLNVSNNYSYSSNRFEISLVNYSCSLKCIEKKLVNYSYFGSCPRSELFSQILRMSSKPSFVCVRLTSTTFVAYILFFCNYTHPKHIVLNLFQHNITQLTKVVMWVTNMHGIIHQCTHLPSFCPGLDHIFIRLGPVPLTPSSLSGLPACTCMGTLPCYEPM